MCKAVKNLEKYVELDDVVINKSEENDFSRFCESHCQDIEEVCYCIKEIKSIIDGLDANDFDKYDEYKLVAWYYDKINEIIKYVLD